MSGDGELRRRLREHGRRIEAAAEHIEVPIGPARGSRRRSGRRLAITGVAVALVAVVGVVIGFGTRGHKHEAITVSPSTTTSTASTAPLVYGTLPPRSGAALAYDGARRQVVLFGGDARQSLGDTWLWDGHGWGEAHPATAPSPRHDAAMAYDPTAKVLVLFGGTQDVHLRNPIAHHDTWTWDGTNWTQQHPRHVPPQILGPATGLAMSYDPRSRSVLLMALPSSHPNLTANGETGDTDFGTWQWTGSDWHELNTPEAPVYVVLADRAYGEPRLAPLPHGAGLLFYSWAGSTASCPGVPAVGRCGGLPDPTGTRYAQTWTWDGTRWTRQRPRIAPAEGTLVASPGPDALPTVFTPDGATWRWTGSDWDETKAEGTAPRAFGGLAVYDDADRNVVAYVGGVDSADEASAGTWTWNGTWTKQTPPRPLPTATTLPPAKCTAGQLSASAAWQGEDGGLRGAITLRNSGDSCALDVRGAAVALHARGASLPLELLPAGAGRDMTTRVLHPDDAAHVVVFWSNWCKPDPGRVSAALTIPGLAATGTTEFNGPDPNSLPRCDAPNSPSGIQFLGFSAG